MNTTDSVFNKHPNQELISEPVDNTKLHREMKKIMEEDIRGPGNPNYDPESIWTPPLSSFDTNTIKIAEGDLTILKTFSPAGYYVIGEYTNRVSFGIQNKPNIIHRYMCKLLLGWKWVDNTK